MTTGTTAVAKVVRKRCPSPSCGGVLLVYQEWEGLMGWLCPRCGYFEPDELFQQAAAIEERGKI